MTRSTSATGRSCPGLFDCHVHVCISNVDLWGAVQQPFSRQFYEAARNLQKTLDDRDHSIRDAGGADLGIKEAVADGLIAGPRMHISITMLSQTGGHGDDWYPSGAEVRSSAPIRAPVGRSSTASTRSAARSASCTAPAPTSSRSRPSGGVLSARDDPRHAHFRPAELEALVEEATAAGMFVMAHAQGADGIKNAVRAGIRSIDHGIYLDDEAIELMLRRGTWFVPTLVAPQGVLDAVDAGRLPAAGGRRQGPDGDRHPPGGVPPRGRGRRPDRDGHRQRGHAARPQPARARAHGGGGMAPGAVLEATTRSAAQLMGLDADLGTIEEGKLADLVVIAGDPYDFAGLARTRRAGLEGRARLVAQSR